ncbi:gephyrin-like molybdotransferase Glp [Clostridium saccharobutylicum]|uniref:Molybdopterin molybdenumtransferase n=1 Tax=Clostridium saccharobutylicum TaxID=169679 RepID=A0A1S8MYB3_CLOSA|nr:gephyrin-like molybdotransferase Glp [Clostridium saccharobutylicum]OOM09160.1 molybdopterin molybdenumtransferase [Clostridium saccharobutylicum]
MLNVELEEAIELMTQSIEEIIDFDEIELIDAYGRISEEDIYAPMNNPPFDRSPLDGYALIADDTKGASKETIKTLTVVDVIYAGGDSKRTIKKGEAIRIMTGAKMPKGANCVIRQEQTNYGEDKVEIYRELSEYDNYCFAGEDIKEGDLLIKKGELLTYVHIGILSSMGITKIKVKSKPRIALLVTGDEVGIPGEPLKEGKIYDSNLHLLYSRLNEFGLKPIIYEIIGDSGERVSKRICEIADNVDFIITTGGVSVGQKDILHDALPLMGAKRLFWKVNLKPGTPAMYSLYKNKPILSLSGNPFAALTTFELLARPILGKITQNKNLYTKKVIGVMEDEFNKSSVRRRFIRAYFNDGKVSFVENKHSSGMLASMVGCNCLIDVREGTPKLNKGDKVEVVLL